MEKIKIVKKISATETLRAMSVGETCIVKTSIMKPTTMRQAIYILRKQGYDYKATERGLINEFRITRTA